MGTNGQWDPSAWTTTTLNPQSSSTQSASDFDKNAWMRAIAPPQTAMITASQWALVTNQSNSIQAMMQNDSETGTSTKPPKLNHINDWGWWKERLRTYVQGQGQDLWMCFFTPFENELEVAGSNPETYSTMSDDDKKKFELEKKAFMILTQALHKDIYHQFVYCTTTKSLWDMLTLRCEGNAQSRKIKQELLKKEFEGFTCMENEGLAELSTRFHHLLSEMFAFKVTASPQELVKRFADSLPAKWSSYLEILKENGVLDTITVYELIQKLENKDVEEKLKAKRTVTPQNPEMYFGIAGGISGEKPASQHAKLQTAFISNSGPSTADQFDPSAYTMISRPDSSSSQQQQYMQQTAPQFTPPSFLDPNKAQQQQAQQQGFYGSSSSFQATSNPNTVRLDTSNFSKVSVEIAKEHMEMLNTLVSAYCGMVAGQIGNINLTNEDYQQIDKEEFEMMDIKWALASAIRRAKEFMERTGRTSLESNNNTKYGFDKNAVTCFNCGEKGHFKRECQKPPKQGNQNPFRNSRQPQQQQNNSDRQLVPVGGNTSGSANSNPHRGLVVQADEICNWSVQLGEGGNGGNGGTACYAKVVEKVEEPVSAGESSEDEDSSGYSGSVDGESLDTGDMSSDALDLEVDELLADAEALCKRKSILCQKAAGTSEKLSQFFSEDGSFSFLTAFMAHVEGQTSQVCDSKPDSVSAVVECAKCLEYAEKESLFEITQKHNQELIVDLAKASEANFFLTKNEKEFKETIKSLKHDVSELQKAVLRKQHANNNLIDTIEKQMVELATARCECDAIKQKLDSYSNSRFVLDHIISVQKEKGDKKCIGYKKCPPPMSHNYSKQPDDEDMPRFEPTVPLARDDFAAGLGFKTGTSSSEQSASENVENSSCEKEQSPPIIEDADSSDDESEEIVRPQSNSVTPDIPVENHILCDPAVKPSKAETPKAMKPSVPSSETNNLLYTLKGDSKIYSDRDFPIKNVNQDLIEKIFEGRTDKFLGNKGNKVTVTQCEPVPREQIRKQCGNQKLPVERKQQVNSGKGKGQVQEKRAQNKNVQAPKAQSPKTEQPRVQQPKVEQSKAPQPKAAQPKVPQSKVEQSKVQKVQNRKAPVKKQKPIVKFVESTGTDKLETFQNKSNNEFVKQVRILKRNEQNNYTQHTNGCDLGPSTSRSQTSVSGSSSGHQHVSPRFVERRMCFECGTIGHIVRYCPYLKKMKGQTSVPQETNYQKQSVSQKQDPRVLKEREKKEKQKNKKVIEKALKSEVKNEKPVQAKTTNAKPVNTKSINSNTGKQKQAWKQKQVIKSGGAPEILFPNHQVIEITFLDDQGRPKSTKAWVPLSN
ncbi:putative transcription factor interactor and regulator CCHC(Zn) family [Helianthus annuus]|nr:putative transcription factor interactor and regulator CCHC(Zn) family [Helianthus annuus]